MLEEIMALQPQELPREHAAPLLDHFRHGDLRVVVGDPLRHAAEELEGPAMALLKRLGAFPGKDLAEEGVAERQRHHEHRHLPLLPPIDDRRLAEIGLGFARPMHQRHEHFRRPPLPASHLFLDDRSAAAIPLFAEPLQNPLGRVPLLLRGLLVGFENLVDQRHERPEDRLFPRLASSDSRAVPHAAKSFAACPNAGRTPCGPDASTIRRSAPGDALRSTVPCSCTLSTTSRRGKACSGCSVTSLAHPSASGVKSATFFDRYAGPVPRHGF